MHNMLSQQKSIVNAMAMNDDDVIFTGGDNGSMCFWDYKSGHCFQKEKALVQPGSLEAECGIYASTFDVTGSRLITCEADKTIKMWKEDTDATPESNPILPFAPRQTFVEVENMINVHYITGVALFYTTLSSEFVMLFRFLLLFEPFLMIGKHLHRVVIGTSEFRETFRIDARLFLMKISAPLLINPQAACMWSPRMALCRGVSPSVSCAFTSAPASKSFHYRK